ncbi:hypothetical protein B0H11DRAFT_1260222 [Mycena galericulata]|nr:hypothetical protein B0H11DRAFT_1260222 [Mycena galericulata]
MRASNKAVRRVKIYYRMAAVLPLWALSLLFFSLISFMSRSHFCSRKGGVTQFINERGQALHFPSTPSTKLYVFRRYALQVHLRPSPPLRARLRL